jgi:hypothetical protein
MGAIYQKAFLTLIGLAGEDAMYGLPGITKLNKFEHRMLVCKHSSVWEWLAEDLCQNTEKSKWYTRGWYVIRVRTIGNFSTDFILHPLGHPETF